MLNHISAYLDSGLAFVTIKVWHKSLLVNLRKLKNFEECYRKLQFDRRK